MLQITDATRKKIPIKYWFRRVINQRVNIKISQSGLYFITLYGEISKISNYDNLFKEYLTRIKK